jgi:hypothetical protein
MESKSSADRVDDDWCLFDAIQRSVVEGTAVPPPPAPSRTSRIQRLASVDATVEEAEVYLQLVKLRKYRPDLVNFLRDTRYVVSLTSGDLLVPASKEDYELIRESSKMRDHLGEEVDLLLHRCVAQAFVSLSGKRAAELAADSAERGIEVHPGWTFRRNRDDRVVICCWVLYASPDAAWRARGAINSPVDGADYSSYHKALRDSDWGDYPLTLLFSMDDIFKLNPDAGYAPDESVSAYDDLVVLKRLVETLSISCGYSEGVDIDVPGQVDQLDDFGFSRSCKILPAGSKWQIDEDCVKPISYQQDGAAVTVIQRIYSVQRGIVLGASFTLQYVTEWMPPPLGGRRRKPRGTRGGKKSK